MRKFYLFSESWYAKIVPLGNRVVDDLFISDENYVGELHIEWIDLNNKKPAYRINCFNDSLDQLTHNLDVIFGLKALPQDASPKLVCGLLLELGFTDATQRANPDEEKGYQDAVSGKPGKIGMNRDKNPEQYAYGQGYLRGLWEMGNQPDLVDLDQAFTDGYEKRLMGFPSHEKDYDEGAARDHYIQGRTAAIDDQGEA